MRWRTEAWSRMHDHKPAISLAKVVHESVGGDVLVLSQICRTVAGAAPTSSSQARISPKAKWITSLPVLPMKAHLAPWRDGLTQAHLIVVRVVCGGSSWSLAFIALTTYWMKRGKFMLGWAWRRRQIADNGSRLVFPSSGWRQA